MIETERLILRAFRDDDREAFAAINMHPEVSAWLSPSSRELSDAMIDRINAAIAAHGFGFWAAERKADRRLVGAIGVIVMAEDLPTPGAMELGWRLHPDAQGAGLATEGARACRDYAFETLGAPEVVAITARTNLRSQAVMRKIGLSPDPSRDFDHPKVPEGDRLRPHVFFAMKRP